MKKTTSKDLYTEVTNKIIAKLEAGIIPWRKPWTEIAPAFNRTSGKPYSFLNAMILDHDGEYATFKQWNELGGKIRKGEKSERIYYFDFISNPALDEHNNPLRDEDGMAIIRKIPFLKSYAVFHISQVEGVEPLPVEKTTFDFTPSEAAEALINSYSKTTGVTITSAESNNAFYRPSTDSISLPSREQFPNNAEFYSTAFHEITHSTGHASRLNREMVGKFGSKAYSKEELIAELGAAFLMAYVGIDTPDTLDNSAAYLQSWIKALKNDNRLFVPAATAAKNAAEYVKAHSAITPVEAPADEAEKAQAAAPTTAAADPQPTPEAVAANAPASALKGLNIAITGGLKKMLRKDAFKRIEELGGVPKKNVTGILDILVIAEDNPEGEKYNKALALNSAGKHIKFIAESDFYKLIQAA